MQLTAGAVQRIMRDEDTSFQPVLQVIDIRKLVAQQATERHRLVVSDGLYYMQAMITSQQNQLVYDGELVNNCIIRLNEFLCSTVVQDYKIAIILNLDVVSGPVERIGNPVNIDPSAAGTAAPPAPTPVAAAPVSSGPPAGGASVRAPPAAAAPGGAGAAGGALSNMYGARIGAPAGAVSHSADTNVVPLLSLNPYGNKWTIRVRVTSKGTVREWNNAKSTGRLFSIDVLDEHGSEMRATFFNEGVTQFYDMIEPGKVYLMTGGRVKPANKKFSSLQADYEINFDRGCVIQPVQDDTRIKTASYNFTKISAIGNLEAKSNVDVIGIVKEASDCAEINTKNGARMNKRDIVIADQSGATIRLTLWGEFATMSSETFANFPVIAVKGAQVSDYNSKSLSTSYRSTLIAFNPDVPETQSLRTWWDREGAHAALQSLSVAGGSGGSGGQQSSVRKTFSSLSEDGSQDSGAITIKATVTFIKPTTRNWYPACPLKKADAPDRTCSKRVTRGTGGSWHCDSCNKTVTTPEYRYVLNASAEDSTGSSWVTMFNETAETLMGKPATEMAALGDSTDDSMGQANDKQEAVFKEACYKSYIMRVRVRNETYNDSVRLKTSVVYLKPIVYAEECRTLLDMIAAYN